MIKDALSYRTDKVILIFKTVKSVAKKFSTETLSLLAVHGFFTAKISIEKYKCSTSVNSAARVTKAYTLLNWEAFNGDSPTCDRWLFNDASVFDQIRHGRKFFFISS